MAAPATATTRARLTRVFQVSGCPCAALIAAPFAAIGAGVPAPTGPSPGCCEFLLAATPYFILDHRTSTPAAFHPAGSGRRTRDGRQVAPTLTDCGPRAGRSVLTLERFLQLAGDLVGRGIHGPLHHFVRTCERLVERLFYRRLAHRDQPCLAGGELLGPLVEFLAREGPAAEPLGDDPAPRTIHPLGHVRFAVPLVDDGRIERADHLVLVQGLDGVQVFLCGRDAAVGGGVDDRGLLVRHDISLISGYPADGSRPIACVAAGR